MYSILKINMLSVLLNVLNNVKSVAFLLYDTQIGMICHFTLLKTFQNTFLFLFFSN